MTTSDLKGWLFESLAQHSGLDRGTISWDSEFADLGIDSSGVVAIAEGLSERLGKEVDPSAVFEARSVRNLLDALSGSGEAEGQPRPTGRQRLDSSEREPIAVVGMACRVPGVGSLDALWALLNENPIAFGSPPSTPHRFARDTTGGYLEEIDQFDAQFFGIGEREAAHMDPQHRVVLELVWEAFEDAGVDPAKVSDASQVGVYLGAGPPEYAMRFHRDPIATGVEARTSVCVATSSVANRVSYTFGFRGPSVAIDTACSSSLVAILAGARAIWTGECDIAVAGGVNLLLEPASWVSLEAAGVLSPSGICAPFTDRADGYVRGEGAGIVVLKRLADTRTSSERVYAAILGGALNHDGRSHGIMAPNPGAQRDLLTSAYKDADVSPGEVRFIETHGTGTLLGDAAEASALGDVIGKVDRREPCYIGSIKSHIGHLEAAAGVAGMIKTCLALARGFLPPAAKGERPNPYIDLDGLGLSLPREATELDAVDGASRPVLAGVSSFGFGGTNAHVVLRSVSPAGIRQRSRNLNTAPLMILPISARSRSSLEQLKEDYTGLLSSPSSNPVAVASAAALRRAHHPWRAVGIGSRRESLAASLEEARLPTEAPPNPSVAFVLSGHGARWELDLSELDRALPAFGDVVEEIDGLLAEELGLSVAGAIEDRSHYEQGSAVTQAAHFLVQCALGQAWLELGVTPEVVVGHSAGEIAAAYLCGVLDLATATRVAVERGRAIETRAAPGRLLHVDVGVDRALDWAAQQGVDAAVAAENSSDSTVLVLAPHDAERLAITDGPNPRVLEGVDFAAHSAGMAEAATILEKNLAEMSVSEPRVPMISTVTGEPPAALDNAYWGANLRNPVRFRSAVQRAIDKGVSVILEIGPRAILRPTLLSLTRGAAANVSIVSSVRSHHEGTAASVYQAVARLYEAGCDIRWATLVKPTQLVDLPRYRWNRTTYWVEQPKSPGSYDVHPQSRLGETETQKSSGKSLPLIAQLAQARDDQHAELLLRHIQALIAGELACSVKRIEDDIRVLDLGLESVSASAIKNQLSEELGATINLADLLADVPLSELVSNLLGLLREDDDYLTMLDEAHEVYAMSDEEVEALLDMSGEI